MKGDYWVVVQKWDKLLKEYERQSGKKVDDDLKMCVSQVKIAPPDIKHHLNLHASRIASCEKMKDKI